MVIIYYDKNACRAKECLILEHRKARNNGRIPVCWAIGYGAWSTGNITDDVIEKYLEHHRNPGNNDQSTIILE